MQIIQIGPYPLSKDCIRGGVEASVYGLSQALAQQNVVHVFDIPRISGGEHVEKDGEVIVHRYCNKARRQIATSRMTKMMAKEILALRPEICHLHGTSLFSWLMYRSLRKETHVIVTVHGLARVEKKNALKKAFSLKRLFQFAYQGMTENRFLSELDYIIVDTEYVKGMIGCDSKKRMPKIFVIPQGIDEAYYSMHCSTESKVMLSVGAIGERKGHLFTIKAFELMRRSGLEAKLVIAGSIANKSYFDKVRDAVDESEFSSDISLYVNLSDGALKELYKNAHVFVLHSEEESQGIVFAEAMAMGMPVVSTRVGGVPYVVRDGATGLLSEYSNVSAFAENMKRMMEDGELWESMSKASKEQAGLYHWNHVGSHVMNLYELVQYG